MNRVFPLLLALVALALAAPLRAQQASWEIEARDATGTVTYDLATGLATGTNGIVVRYNGIVLTADSATVNKTTGEAVADGNVRVQSGDMLWTGEHIRYNFLNRSLRSESFRAGKSPVFVGGQAVTGDLTNEVYTATNAFLTLDDYERPFFKVRARRLVIEPGKRFAAHGATLYAGSVPVFYLPYFSQRQDATRPGILVKPGYDSRFGGYLLGSYGWRWGQAVEARLHADYRAKRGFAGGPDLDLHLGQWGDAMLRYYYLHDDDPELDLNLQPYDADRQRLDFNWFARPETNTTLKARVGYASDDGVRREFFEGEYRRDPQPNTFVEARHFWDNFALSARAQARVNDFFNSVERLPEVRLAGFRQSIAATPLFYESDSSAGWYRRRFSETNVIPGLDYEAARADTFHQILLPHTFFGWLNVTPRVGGRLSYYSEAEGPGAVTQEETRAILHTGVEASFKASRTWANVQSDLLHLDGVRHILEPSINYAYIPRPGTRPNELPQFDYELPALHLQPLTAPDFNAIDALDAQNVVRLGVRNRLQTKRAGRAEEFLFWDVFTDWRLDREPGEETWNDLWSEFKIKPRAWLAFDAMNRFDVRHGEMRLAYHALTLQPNTRWHWRGAYLYLRDDFAPAATAWGPGEESAVSTFYFRLNENWGARLSHYYDLRAHELREHGYALYRDFRSWTGALALRIRENRFGRTEYTIGFNLSLKALPRYDVGEDTVLRDVLLTE